MSDEIAEAGQPDAGQADGGQGGSQPYADYLARVPEEYRETVEPVFADWNRSVNGRFEEAAQQRKTWEPYEQIGLNQHDPQYVQQAIALAELAQSPQDFQQWFQQYAQANGLQAAVNAAEQIQQDEFGFQDPQQQLDQLLEQKLGPISQQIEQIAQWREQQELQARTQAYEQVLDGQLSELKAKHEETFKQFPGVEEMVQQFAANYVNSNPQDWENAIPKAWQQAESLINQVSKNTLQSKVDAPAPAEGGGVADLNREAPKSWDDARVEARKLLQQWNRQ